MGRSRLNFVPRQQRGLEETELDYEAIEETAAASPLTSGVPQPVTASQPGFAPYAPLLPDVISVNALE